MYIITIFTEITENISIYIRGYNSDLVFFFSKIRKSMKKQHNTLKNNALCRFLFRDVAEIVRNSVKELWNRTQLHLAYSVRPRGRANQKLAATVQHRGAGIDVGELQQ